MGNNMNQRFSDMNSVMNQQFGDIESAAAHLMRPAMILDRLWALPDLTMRGLRDAENHWAARAKSPISSHDHGEMINCQYEALIPSSMEIQFTTRILKEGRTFVAHALELDVSSCGRTQDKAASNLKQAAKLFLEEADRMGTLEQILEEAGYSQSRQKLAPKFISVQRTTLPLPTLSHAKH